MKYKLFLLTLLSAAAARSASLQNPDFTTASYLETPLSYAQATYYSNVRAINNQGAVAGDYANNPVFGSAPVFGFIYQNSTFSSFPTPGNYATVSGINDSNAVVGTYDVPQPTRNAPEVYRGFVIQSNGDLTVLAFPGAYSTSAAAINDTGTVVGSYTDTYGGLSHGYIYTPDGKYTSVIAPGAFGMTLTGDTTLSGINNAGQIVGFNVGTSENTYAFLYEGGTFTRIYGGSPADINDSGAILTVGNNGSGVLYPDGNFATIQAPSPLTTTASGLNDAGQITTFNAILTPVPEPGSLPFAATALSLFLIERAGRYLGRVRSPR